MDPARFAATVLQEAVTDAAGGDATGALQEAYDKVRAMLQREDRGWLPLFGTHGEDEGLTLEDLKNWSRKIRESVVGAPWISHGLTLRTSYVWRDGIRHAGIPEPKQGRGAQLRKYIDDPMNQYHYFGDGARYRREGCLYHDGAAFYVGDDRTKRLEAVPMSQITDQLFDPSNKGIIWAYRRSWIDPNDRSETPKERVLWYFTDQFVAKRRPRIKYAGTVEPVAMDAVIFDQHANSMTGTAYGAPDALAAYIWNGIARDLFMDGVTMSEALATFAFQAATKSQTGATNAAMKLADGAGPGSSVVTGAPNSLVPTSSAGKVYNFGDLSPVTAVIAAALDVSNIALTMDTANAGSSYGSAQTLDLPTRLAMEMRRNEHIEFELRVLRWMAPKETGIEVYFLTLDDSTAIYRELQALGVAWATGLYEAEPIEKRISMLLQIMDNTVPDGVLLPNNKDSLARSDIDADTKDGSGGVGNPNGTPPGQGQNSGVGKGLKANDIRTEQFLSRLEAFIQSEREIEANRHS